MIDEPPICLEAAAERDAPVLASLLELYLHDLSEIFEVDVRPGGRFGYDRLPSYWREPDRRFPFLIRVGGELAGFALVTRGSPATGDPTDLDVSEFFVLRPVGPANGKLGGARRGSKRSWPRVLGTRGLRLYGGSILRPPGSRPGARVDRVSVHDAHRRGCGSGSGFVNSGIGVVNQAAARSHARLST